MFGLMMLMYFTSSNVVGQVFITELADPNNDAGLRYIELYNAGTSAVDFTEGSGWRIDKYTNASTTVSQTLSLTGTIPASGYYIIATGVEDSDFLVAYGIEADQFDGADNNVAGSNGDDNLELYDGAGTLIDQFGVPGTDGTNTNHEFEDGRAERKATVTTGNATWDVSEWNIDNDGTAFPGNGTQDAPADFDPSSWIGENDGPVFIGSTPVASNQLETSFDLTVELNERGQFFYVVVNNGATAPNVSEVKAGTASGGSAAVVAGTGTVISNTAVVETVSGLTASSSYDIYIVAEDIANNQSTLESIINVSTTANVAPSITGQSTPDSEKTSNIIVDMSEVVTVTDATGFSVSIGGLAASINGITGSGTNQLTLTIAETITKNSGAILLSYDNSSGNVTDGTFDLENETDLSVTNNTTLNVVANLEAARAFAGGELVEVTGDVTVSYVRNSGETLYAQDANRGVIIQDDNTNLTTTYNAGDVIGGVKGTINVDFTGVIEIIPVADLGAATSTGESISPDIVTIADFNTNFSNYESRVVKVEGVNFLAAGTEFDNGGDNYDITDGTNTTVFRDNFTEVRYEAGTFIPYGRIDITAIGGQFQGSAQIVPFSLTEAIEDIYAPEFTNAPTASTPTTSAFDVTFRLDEPGTVYYLVDETTNTTPDAATVLASSETVAYGDPAVDGTISLSALNDNTEYFVHIVAKDDEGTPNEQTSVTTISATTLEVVYDATSDIVAAGSPISALSISSLANAEADGVDVFNFKVTDDNATDTEPTAINTIVIENNNAATWSSIIEGASITDGTTVNSATSITDTEITFDLSGSQYFVTGGTEITFTLSVWLSTTQTDGTELQFIIPTDHAFEADVSGSVIKPTLTAAVSSATHTIDVEATTFATTVPSSSVGVNTDFSVGVIAQDANGNTDIAARSIDISVSAGNLGGSGTLTSATGISGQAMVDGEFTFTDLQYSQEEDIRLTVTDGTISSNTLFFSVIETSGVTQTETFDNFPETGNTYNDGSFIGQDGSTWEYVQARGDQPIDGATPMLGRGRTPDAFIESGTISGGIDKLSFDYSQAFSSNVELEVYVNGTLVGTVTSDNQVGEVLNSGEITVEVPGDFILKFFNPNGGQVNIDNVSWTSFESTEPIITVNQSEFEPNFGEVEIGSLSSVSSFTITAQNLEEDVLVSLPAGFEASLSEDFSAISDAASSLTIEANSGEIENTVVYVRFAPDAAESFSGELSLSSLNASTRTVAVEGVGLPEGLEIIVEENFNNCDELNGFTSFSVTGEQEWGCTSSGFEGAGVRMNGFSGGAVENEDWLISPELNLSNYESSEFDFYTNQNFSGGDFKVFISEDYVVGEDPTSSTYNWTEITGVTLSSGNWVNSGSQDISTYNTEKVHIAFVYYSTSEAAAEWLVDNFRVRGVLGESAPNIILDLDGFDSDFGRVEFGSVSEIRNYSFSAENLTEAVTVNVPNGFEISLNSDFSGDVYDAENSLIIEANEGSIVSTSVFVRFVPTEQEAALYNENIEHVSANATTRNVNVFGQEGLEGGVISIFAARALSVGTDVKIRGTVIGGPNNETANRIIYDGTGGIVIRETEAEGLLTEDLAVGDSVVVSGTLGSFNQLIQVSSLTELEVVSNGADLPSFETATIDEIKSNYENYASSYVRIEGVTFTDERTTFVGGGGDGNFSIEDSSGEMTFRIGNGEHPLVGQEVPTQAVTLQGYIGRFNDAVQIFVNDASGILEEEVGASLTVDLETIDFGTVEVGENSEAQAVTVQATKLDSNITLSVDGDFEISLSSDAGFVKELGLDLDQAGDFFGDVFIRFVPTEEGVKTAELNVTSGDFNILVGLSGEGEEVVTSVNEKMLQGVTYYPNPALDILNINLSTKGAFEYEVISLQGAQIIEGSAEGDTEVSLGNLETGVYILKVKQSDKQFNTRFIKQ